MKIEWKEVNIKGRKIKALLTIKEKGDRELLKRLYSDWNKLNKELKSISTRGINLPETISENAFALFFPDCFRVVSLKGMKCSFDCINIKTGSRIQVKASSVASDLTTFGPRSEWDELFFLDFSASDGSFKVYKIEPDWIYKHMVNKKQSFSAQQEQGRRPRFSIIENIIKPRKLKPVKVFQL
ncbi:MAG: Bsp6I family type II restriction endonuclease [Candidatus Paceibacterota bacterium]